MILKARKQCSHICYTLCIVLCDVYQITVFQRKSLHIIKIHESSRQVGRPCTLQRSEIIIKALKHKLTKLLLNVVLVHTFLLSDDCLQNV